MIIWSNGQEWSAHETWFIDTKNETVETVTDILSTFKGSSIVGVVEMIDWRESSQLATVEYWLKCHVLDLIDVYNENGGPSPGIYKLPMKYRQIVVDALNEESEFWSNEYEVDVSKVIEDLKNV